MRSHIPSRLITCNLTGTSASGKAGFVFLGRAGLATPLAGVAGDVGASTTVTLSFLAAALLRRGVVGVSGLADPVDTLEATLEERPLRGVDFLDPAISSMYTITVHFFLLRRGGGDGKALMTSLLM